MHHYLKTSESAHTVAVSLWTLSPVQGNHASGKQRWSELYLLGGVGVLRLHNFKTTLVLLSWFFELFARDYSYACHLKMGQYIDKQYAEKSFLCTIAPLPFTLVHPPRRVLPPQHDLHQFIHLRKLVPNWTILQTNWVKYSNKSLIFQNVCLLFQWFPTMFLEPPQTLHIFACLEEAFLIKTYAYAYAVVIAPVTRQPSQLLQISQMNE